MEQTTTKRAYEWQKLQSRQTSRKRNSGSGSCSVERTLSVSELPLAGGDFVWVVAQRQFYCWSAPWRWQCVATAAPHQPVRWRRLWARPPERHRLHQLVSSTRSDQGGKAEFVFFGALYCPHCAAERWAIVKSLSQFGRFAHMSSTTNGQGVPTFDLTHATYQSKYLSFVARDMEDQNGNALQALSTDQRLLFSQYDPSGGIPLVAVGGYAMSGSPILPDEISGRPFNAVQSALKHNAGDTFVQDINAEANELTALICHADGMHPQAACGRPVIRHLVASVR